jgi:acetyl esterase/lipase
VEYGRAGDRSLKLDLLRPKDQGDKVLPVVVAIHGGGWQGGNKESFRWLAAGFAATGNYVGISVGYRLTGEAIWPAQIHDCKAAIRWVRANAATYKLDEKRIGVTGNSAGGHLVALLGTSGDVKELEGDCGNAGYSSRVSCVVDFCGPSDFLKFLEQPGAGGRGAVTKLFGGPPAEHAAAARAASPITWASADDPPFLIFHGTEDRTVPFRQGETMAAALEKVGVPVTFVRVEGGGHGLGGREINQRHRNYFERHLRGQEVEIPATPIQAESAKK